MSKCYFVNSGSEADDQAFILARLVTGRPKIFAKYRSYHGTTLGGLGVGGDPRRSAIEPGPPGTVRFFDPYCYRCDFGKEFPGCGIHCLDALERQLQLENPATVAAVVVEPVTGAAGGFPLPPGYLTRLRALCDKYGILLIADEVITGFGRTGAWFGVDHEGVVPDMLVLAKGLTSGYVPMGAVVVRAPIAEHFEKRMLPLGSTYTAHPLACAAALACLEEYDKGGWIENARRMGERLLAALRELAGRHPCVGDVRGQGLLRLPGTGARSGDEDAAGAAQRRFAAAHADSPPGLGRRATPDGPRQHLAVVAAADSSGGTHRRGGGETGARADLGGGAGRARKGCHGLIADGFV